MPNEQRNRRPQISTQRPSTKPPRRTPPRTEPPRRTPPRNELATPRPLRSDPNKVLCHQCGSFFSNKNDNCNEFDSSVPEQKKYCDPGEACLYYSWQKSATETAAIRECFSPTILLGSVNDPLRVQTKCEIKNISETPGAQIMACLCNTDLCNAIEESFNEPVAFPLVADPPTVT